MNESTQNNYSHPTQVCDIVMKGGITSGVVYPDAVCELAEVYSFKAIGGTSAGAIAAAATAAAEYRRVKSAADAGVGARKMDGGGFVRFKYLSTFLQKNLVKLFQPDPITRPLYRMLLSGLDLKKKWGRARFVAALYKNFWIGALCGIFAGLVVLALIAGPWMGVAYYTAPRRPDSGDDLLVWLGVFGLLLALLLMLASGGIGAAAQLIYRALWVLPRNSYGLTSGRGDAKFCNGPPHDPFSDDDPKALTCWLADELDGTAGKSQDEPLTFGDLWGADGRGTEEEPAIVLQMLTTNLTFGRPYKLPFNTGKFYYDPKEFRKYFPERIVKWMEDHPRTPQDDDERRTWGYIRNRYGLLPLPDPQNFPIVVAARMSLSFPVLISAIPLHAIDWTGLDDYLLTTRQLKNPARFINKLRASTDEVSTFLRQNIPEGVELSPGPDDELGVSPGELKIVIDQLNKVIKGDCIFEESRFKAIKLGATAEKHLREYSDEKSKYPPGGSAVRVNRALLEEVYPDEIRRCDKRAAPFVMRRCLFSDGGICSNFPLFLFDKPLPKWPTFGFNLLEVKHESPEPEDNVRLIRDNVKDGLSEAWDRFDEDKSESARLVGFFVSIVNTMYNWADNTQMRVPGYRDRVVHIELTKEEGGLNLNMDEALIKKITERGKIAGRALRDRFTGNEPGSPVTWDSHRWIRYRSFMALLERALKDYATVYRKPDRNGFVDYPDLLGKMPPDGFNWTPSDQHQFAADITAHLMQFESEWAKSDYPLTEGAPEPTPALSVRPLL